MGEYAEILVGTDGSAVASSGVAVAAGLACGFDVPLLVVCAWTESGGEAYLAASETTEAAASAATGLGAAAVHRLEPAVTSTPADALITVAEEHPQALLVVGGSGLDHAMDRFGGNTAHQLTHHSPVDLLVVHPDRVPPVSSIAIATDGSATATRAVYRGVAVAQALGVVPTLVTIAHSREDGEQVLAAITDDLHRRGIDVSVEMSVVGLGLVVPALVDAASAYDLLVIGNQGMSGPSRLMGSVSNRLSHEFPTSLLIVRTVV